VTAARKLDSHTPSPRRCKPMPLALLTCPGAIEDDLDFYFERAAAAVGLSSHWQPLVDLAIMGARGLSRAADPMSESRIEAAGRVREIERIFARMNRRDFDVLAAAHAPRRWSHTAGVLFGPWTGAAIMTPTFEAADARDAMAFIERLAERGDRNILRAISSEASRMLLAAWNGYIAARRGE